MQPAADNDIEILYAFHIDREGEIYNTEQPS